MQSNRNAVTYLLTYLLIYLLTYLYSYCKANGTKPDSKHKLFKYLLLEVQWFCKGSSICMDNCGNCAQTTVYIALQVRLCGLLVAVICSTASSLVIFLVVLGFIMIFCGSSDTLRRTFAVLCGPLQSFWRSFAVVCSPLRSFAVLCGPLQSFWRSFAVVCSFLRSYVVFSSTAYDHTRCITHRV